MIHASNHEQGCLLMADNMANRKDELFIDIQNQGQFDLFNQTIENEDITQDEIYAKVDSFLIEQANEVGLDVFLSSFYTKYGLLCKSSNLKDVLRLMEDNGRIVVIRTPPTSPTGKVSTFFTERKGQSVTIRRSR
jgi:hypothetical protein